MELTDANERNLATTSDIYFQNALDDTASFTNVPDVDDDELAEFLAVVVDRTGQPVEVRSNNDQFSCDIRNLKSAQSQFPLVTQPKRMISQTVGSVEERIAEERESSNAQIRTMLDEQRRTIIAEYGEKVLHHEFLAAQAEQDRKILQEELLRQQQDFREVHQQDLMKQKELQKFQNSTFDEFAQKKFIEDQKIIMELSGRLQELQNEVNCMNDSMDFRDAESTGDEARLLAMNLRKLENGYSLQGKAFSRSRNCCSTRNGECQNKSHTRIHQREPQDDDDEPSHHVKRVHFKHVLVKQCTSVIIVHTFSIA